MRCPWPVWFATICMATCLTVAVVPAQETENRTPPAILYLVPHLDLQSPDGSGRLFAGIDAAFAMPLSLRTNLTATHFASFHGSESTSVLFNYDKPVGGDTIVRGSVGIFDDDFGYGITAHRFMKGLGVGAFVQNVDSDWQAGVMLTTPIKWGVRLGPVRRPTADTRWYSSGGSLDRLGARAALEYRRTDAGSVLATRAAFFPRYEHSWPRGGGDAQSASATGLQFNPPAHLAWKYEAEGPIRTGAAVLDGVAYVGSYDEWLYAVDVKSGRRLWRFPANSPVTAAPSVFDGQVYFGTQAGELFCIRPPRRGQVPAGHMLWRYQAGAAISGSPLVTGTGLVFFGATDGKFHAVDRATGKLRWSQQTGGPIVAGASKALYQIPAGLDENVQATSRAGAILCASTDGKLYAFAETTGELVWTLDTGAPMTAAAAIHRSTAYVGNYEGKLWAVNVGGGHVQWSATVPGAIVTTPAVSAGELCVVTRDGRVVVLSAEDGKERWRRALPSPLSASPTLVAGQKVYVTGRDGFVRALDLRDGSQVWEHFAGEPLTTGATIAESHMLVGGEKGGMYAYRQGAGRAVQVAHASTQPIVLTAAEDVELPPAPVDTAPTVAPALTTDPGVADFPRPTLPPPQTPVSKPQPDVALTLSNGPEGGFAAPQMPDGELTAGPRTSATERVISPREPVRPVPREQETPPVTPEVPAPSPVEDKPEPPVPAVSEPPDDDDPLHLTVLTVPVHGDEPLLVTNRNWAFVGGSVRDPATVASIEVNGRRVAIEDNRFLHREVFEGPGSYVVRVKAVSTQGAVSERIRRVQVILPSDPQVPQTVRISGEPQVGSTLVSFTVGLGGSIGGQRIVAEIQRPDGVVVQRWTHPGAGPLTVTWDGVAMSGHPAAPGEYVGVFAMMVGGQMMARIRQPLQLGY